MKREFLMLAQTYDPAKTSPAGWMLSEKLDGERGFWDGGVSLGIPKDEVPWANTTKDSRYIHRQIATGLWSRNGHVIAAPPWFIEALPHRFLDIELYAGVGNWETVHSTIKKLVPVDAEWRRVRAMILDTPPLDIIMQDGWVKTPNYTKLFRGCIKWCLDHAPGDMIWSTSNTYFRSAYATLCATIKPSDILCVHKQIDLPMGTDAANAAIEAAMAEITARGGEGVVLRRPMSFWNNYRSYDVLKHKPEKDSEATIVGFVTGRVTAKGSKLRGLIGALVVQWQDKIFELSGLTDEERKFDTYENGHWAYEHPEEACPESIQGKYFKRGDTVSFKYRELTQAGIPKEARYYRKRDVTV